MAIKRWLSVTLGVVAIAAAGYWSAQRYAEMRVGDEIARVEAAMGPEARIAYEQLDVQLIPFRVVVDGLRFTPPPGPGVATRAERVVLHEFERNQQLPVRMRLELNNMRQKVSDLPPKSRSTLQKLGYSEIQGDYTLDYRYDVQQQHLFLNRLSARLTDMGRVDVSGQLAALRLEPDQPLGVQRHRLIASDFVRARVTYRDESLIARGLAQAERERGVNRDQLASRLLRHVETSILEGDADEALPAPIKEPLEAFLHAPETLRIVAEPPAPRGVAQLLSLGLVDRQRLLSVLNLRLESE